MKKDIHPQYVEATVRCSCGNTFTTRSTTEWAVARRYMSVDSLAALTAPPSAFETADEEEVMPVLVAAAG